MTIMFLLTLFRMFSLYYGFNHGNGIWSRQTIQITSVNTNVPDYEIPRWVYKKVFTANKPINVKKYEKYVNKYLDE